MKTIYSFAEHKMENKYFLDIENNICKIFFKNKNAIKIYGENPFCIIDLEDFEKVNKLTWYIDNYGYVVNKSFGNNKKLHRLIMNCPENLTVDHIFHNLLDNRKSELRICTQQEQNWNTKKPKHNKSGTKGVWFDKSRNKWCAEILNYKKKIFKRFETMSEAIEQRKAWENVFFKEYKFKVKEGDFANENNY